MENFLPPIVLTRIVHYRNNIDHEITEQGVGESVAAVLWPGNPPGVPCEPEGKWMDG